MEKTVEVGKRLLRTIESLDHPADPTNLLEEDFIKIADLSCGNAAIAKQLCRSIPSDLGRPAMGLFGDFAPGYEYTGPIEETIEQIPEVDLFICSETLEHLNDPDTVLRQIREKSSKLLLSTPNCSWPDPNPEHYWSWDQEAVQEMLIDAGWNPRFYEESLYIQPDGQPLGYRYQIWACE